MIYLDNAATTLQKPVAVRNAMLKAFDTCANAGRGGYEGAMAAAEYVYTARERAANLFGMQKPEEIVFTHNATHALNIAIKGLASRGNCVISGYEHNSVLRPVFSLKNFGVNYTVARGRLFDREDMIQKFKKAIRRNTKFAVCTHMSNVFGYILPIKEIDELCYKKGIPLIIDAAQSAGSVSIKMAELRATVCICAPGHKGLYGPQGTGILACRNGEKLKTFVEGGTGSVSAEIRQPDFMPDRFESGTQNIPGIAGLSEGIFYVLENSAERILDYERKLIRYIANELIKIPQIRVYAAKDSLLQGGVLSFAADNISAEEMALLLSDSDIAVRSGMHCSPLAHETVGTARGTVRVSVSSFTTENDAELFVEAIRRIV